ncbi:oxidoreductase [Spongiactinospora rosea]|uniref:Oxidoreductase n=1 Tax=Spongiactinospora rosea TaxID=2248750 RepID=A0A366LMQ8_9ACTN|nr:PDR/VanB family oxidoreductase [Spongiactinospora rosea]RBQ14940.1 oxidoreductase [Spongiactinospora rosea]
MPPPALPIRTLVVSAAAPIADDVMAVELSDPAGRDLPVWTPGAHIDLRTPGGHLRQYSLCGDPGERSRWRVAVLRQPAGRGGSESIHRSLSVGDRVRTGGPRNRFALVPATTYHFIAGGIGITPILPMIAAVAASGADWRLLYGGRRRAGMAFLPELSRYGPQVTIAPQDETGLLDLPGFLSRPRPGAAIYCCGPEPLLAAAQREARHWPEASFHVERFQATATDPGEATGFDVVLHRQGRSVRVEPGQAIIEALEAAGVTVPSSCREGICGTCETDVLAGVPDHRDTLLSDAERAANTCMFVCVSRSLTERLVLDL